MTSRAKFVDNSCPGIHEPLSEQEYADGENTLALFSSPGGLWREYEVALTVMQELDPRACRRCMFTAIVRTAFAIAMRDGLHWSSPQEILKERTPHVYQ